MRPFFLLALRTGRNGQARFSKKKNFFSKIFLWSPKGILTRKKPTLGYQRKNFEKKNLFWKICFCHFDQWAMPIGKMVLLFILPLGNPEICQDSSTHVRSDQALLMINLVSSQKSLTPNISAGSVHGQLKNLTHISHD